MSCAECQITTRIKLDDLHRLLTAMTPMPLQRTGPDAPRVFDGVDWDAVLSDAVARMVTPRKPIPPPFPYTPSARPKRTYERPFSHVAALLPPCEPTRSPRAARLAPLIRATPNRRSLAVAEHKAPRTVAELRTRLDSGETPEQWAASCVLSPRVLSYLTEEELAMLPAEVRGPRPEFFEEEVTIRRERTPEPCAQDVQPPSRPLSAIIVILASLLACICAVYFLVSSS